MDQLSTNKARSTTGYGQYGHSASVETLRLEDLLPDQRQAGQQPSRNGAEHQLRAAQRRLEQLSIAAKTFSTQLDFQKLLDDIAEYAHRVFPVDRVVVYSNIDGQLAVEVVSPMKGKIPAVSDDARWCVRYLKPKVSNEPRVATRPRNGTAPASLADAHQAHNGNGNGADPAVRNSVCVPFVASQNRVLGVVELQNKLTGGSFTEDDTRAALCLARIATSALDRARLFFRIEEWRKSIETLLSFNATVNQRLAPEEMVRELVSNVTGFLGAQGGMAGVAIRTDAGIYLECDGFYFGDLWSNLSRRWAPGEGIPGTVFETQFPYLCSDYKQDALRERDLCEAFELGSCICVPIKNRKEEVLGFFQLHRRKGEPEFTWQEAAFLETLGNTAAVAIENARLVKSLEIKNEQVRSLSENHVNRLEAERRHIARELHDETGQVLIGLKLRLQILGGLLTEDQSDAKVELAELRTQVNKAAVQLKDMAKRLRPPTLDELGFEATLRQLVSEFRRRRNIEVNLDVDVEPRLSGEQETALYRIVQECLTNVAKHAQAGRVDISFYESADQQILRIADDGIGFEQDETNRGLGHVGIKERVTMLGGQMRVASRRGAGTTVEVVLRSSAAE